MYQISILAPIDLLLLLTNILHKILINHPMDCGHLFICYYMRALMDLVEGHQHVDHVTEFVPVEVLVYVVDDRGHGILD